jgi:glycosyltransferase involved in cell wall biosynthesis
LRIWLIHIAERPPTDPGTRPFRYHLLARELLARGHTVTQWVPTLVHATKAFRAPEHRRLDVQPGWEVQLVHAGRYRRHVGLARLMFYRRLAKRFGELARAMEPPDLIVCGLPEAGLCLAAAEHARRVGAAVVIDVQDVWPDALLSILPSWARPLARWSTRPIVRATRRAIAAADALTAVSATYLAWGRAFAPDGRRVPDRFFPLAIEPPRLDETGLSEARARLREAGVRPDLPTACYVGILGETNDLATVIDACRLLESRGARPLQLVICGDGPRAAALRERAQGLRHCHFLGWSDGARMAAAMGMSSIGLATYRAGAAQSIPNKPLEYLAHGLAVVNSLPGELAAILEGAGAGVQYRPGDASGLADLLDRLAREDAARREMQARARALYREQFDSTRVYRDMAAWLEQVLATSVDGRTAPRSGRDGR